MASLLQENIKLEEMEKKRQKRKTTDGEKSPVSSKDVVDKLLHEIRDGTTLRHRCSNN